MGLVRRDLFYKKFRTYVLVVIFTIRIEAVPVPRLIDWCLFGLTDDHYIDDPRPFLRAD